MKKLLSTALILSLLLVSLFSFPASAASGDFAAAENRKVYSGTQSTALNDTDGVLVSWGSVKENTDSAYATVI